MALFAVFGNPIAHSLSPQIHQAFARQHQTELTYQHRLVPLDGFINAIKDFTQEGGVGANITVPFKTEAYKLVEQLTERARAAQAVNTLFWQQGKLWGDNTDGEGLIRDITEHHHFELKQKRILLLGAGGAARGLILPLLQQQPLSLTIANRTFVRAQQLAELFDIEVKPVFQLQPDYDVIINATSSSLNNAPLPLASEIFKHAELAYDLMYGNQPTVFLQQAKKNGCSQTIDGLGMLVAQAAASYRLWHRFQPDIQPVIQQLRQKIAAV